MSSFLSTTPVGFTQAARGKLVALAVLATLLACFFGGEHLGAHALWLDEAYTVHDSNRSVVDILMMTGDRGASVHPPVPYLVMRPLVAVCGRSEQCLRTPSVLFFAATAFCLVVAAGRLFGWGAAWFATIFWPSLPYAIKYAQQARAYTLLAFLSALSLVLAIRAFRVDGGPAPRPWVFACLGGSLGLVASTHLLGALWIGALGGWCLLWRRLQAGPTPSRKAITLGAVGFAGAASLGAVGLLAALGSDDGHLGSAWGPASHYWRLAIGLVSLGSFERTVPALVLVGVVYGLATRRFTAVTLLALAIAPLILFAVRRPAHFVTVRHIMPSVVVVALLACAGFAALLEAPAQLLSRLRTGAPCWLGMPLGVVFAGVPLVAVVSTASSARARRATAGTFEPWDLAAAWIDERKMPGAVAVTVPTKIVRYPLEFYRVGAPLVDGNVAAVTAALDDHRPPRVFVIWSHVDRRARERQRNRVLGVLRTGGYTATGHQAFGNRTIIVKVFDRSDVAVSR